YDGVKYHHILETKTGYPADTDVRSVTVVSDSSLEGDALSTICLILGEEKSKEILEKYNAEAIFY
ncbi:MAG: FAD:protein FMN transferase, partial [Lachnospiraceae bacterium]|nr:FAD:protein FMN transferase [Lachnospiraceae bacterium]